MFYAQIPTGFYVFFFIGLVALIGLLVFFLRKKIPGLGEYEEKTEEENAEDNLSRILVSVDEDELLKAKEEAEKRARKKAEEEAYKNVDKE